MHAWEDDMKSSFRNAKGYTFVIVLLFLLYFSVNITEISVLIIGICYGNSR